MKFVTGGSWGFWPASFRNGGVTNLTGGRRVIVFGSVTLEFGSQGVIMKVFQVTHFEVVAFNFLGGVSLLNSSTSAFRFLLDLRYQVMGT